MKRWIRAFAKRYSGISIILNGLTSEINQLETTVQEHIGKHPHIEIKQDLAAVVVRAANNKQKVDKILESHLDQNAIDRLFKEFDEMGKILRRLDRDK